MSRRFIALDTLFMGKSIYFSHLHGSILSSAGIQMCIHGEWVLGTNGQEEKIGGWQD
jgi:hypothetical protein